MPNSIASLTLTKRQKELVDFLRDYRKDKGISPTQREICERFGYTSFGTLQKHIRLLLDKGVLVRDWNKRRALLPAEELHELQARQNGFPPLTAHTDTAGPAGLKAVSGATGVRDLPLFGAIAAGSPIDVASEQETVSVPDVLTRRGENYVLRVRGNSMIDDGIQDGDFVVVHRRRKAENGEMVAALVNGEATLKRFYREGNGHIRLQPANERMAPLMVREEDLEIQGVVVGLMRRY